MRPLRLSESKLGRLPRLDWLGRGQFRRHILCDLVHTDQQRRHVGGSALDAAMRCRQVLAY